MQNPVRCWYTVEEIAERVWRIDDHGEDNIYLIEGKEEALLIDTGWGLADLRGLIESLTPLPVMVVNSHCHPDHVCGNFQFSDIHIHPKDESMMMSNFTPESRAWMKDSILSNVVPPGFQESPWLNAKLNSITPLDSNAHFNLGKRKIDVIEIAGHTWGSVCLWIPEEGILFSGDSIKKGEIWLHCEECAPLSVYRDEIRKLQNLTDPIRLICPGHGSPIKKPELLSEIEIGIEKILSGEYQGSPYQTFLGESIRCDLQTCSILHRKDNL